MIIEIDFNSNEAIYIQLCNQIIMGIATDQLKVGETLPSVRQLADTIGINMHTVNKAYSVLRQEGFLTIDRRKGAVIAIDADKIRALEEMKRQLGVVLARGCCRNISREEVHALIDERAVFSLGKKSPETGRKNCKTIQPLYRNRTSSGRTFGCRGRHGRPYAYRSGSDRGKAVPAY